MPVLERILAVESVSVWFGEAGRGRVAYTEKDSYQEQNIRMNNQLKT